jgi:hypothetical protein
MKLYSDDPRRRNWRMVVDGLIACWTIGAGILGLWVHAEILNLQAIGTSISQTGRTFNSWIDDFRMAVPGQNIPLIGSALSDYLKGLADSLQSSSGDSLTNYGQEINGFVASLAVYLGIAACLLAVLCLTTPYLIFRLRRAREMGEARTFVESARAKGQVRQAEGLLAFRALVTLRFTRIVDVSDDPLGDLVIGNHQALANEMLSLLGLDGKRLYGSPGGGLPVPREPRAAR